MSETSASSRGHSLAALFLSALGINAWVLLLLVPTLHRLGLPHPATRLPTWAVFLPLTVLAWGVARMGRVLLLGAYPISLALLHAVYQGPSQPSLFTPLTLGLAALSLFAYLVGTTAALEVTSRRDDARSRRPLASRGSSRIWLQRRLVYWGLAAAAVAIPASLLYVVDFHGPTGRQLQEDYGPAAAGMRALLALLALTLWFWIFHAVFVTALEAHRRGDMDLRLGLRRLTTPTRGRLPLGRAVRLLGLALGVGLLLWLRQRYAAGGGP